VWKAGEQGRYSKELLRAALFAEATRPWDCQRKTAGDRRDLTAPGILSSGRQKTAAYFIETLMVLKATMLMLTAPIKDSQLLPRD